MDAYYPAAIIIITAGVLISILKEKLTVKAAFTGAFLSMLIFWGAGFTGLALLTTFFILGSGATAWKLTAKKQDRFLPMQGWPLSWHYSQNAAPAQPIWYN
jgi:uncharacterized membrane protein